MTEIATFTFDPPLVNPVALYVYPDTARYISVQYAGSVTPIMHVLGADGVYRPRQEGE